MEISIMRRTPNRFISAAANGPIRPNRANRTANAAPTFDALQPNFLLKRPHEHARRPHRARYHEHREKGRRRYRPAVVNVAASQPGGNDVGKHVPVPGCSMPFRLY
jgi:hypothetical protein